MRLRKRFHQTVELGSVKGHNTAVASVRAASVNVETVPPHRTKSWMFKPRTQAQMRMMRGSMNDILAQRRVPHFSRVSDPPVANSQPVTVAALELRDIVVPVIGIGGVSLIFSTIRFCQFTGTGKALWQRISW